MNLHSSMTYCPLLMVGADGWCWPIFQRCVYVRVGRGCHNHPLELFRWHWTWLRLLYYTWKWSPSIPPQLFLWILHTLTLAQTITFYKKKAKRNNNTYFTPRWPLLWACDLLMNASEVTAACAKVPKGRDCDIQSGTAYTTVCIRGDPVGWGLSHPPSDIK